MANLRLKLAETVGEKVGEFLQREGLKLLQGGKLAAPPIIRSEAEAATQRILEHAASERTPKYPRAKEPVFAPADVELTKQRVPQTSVAGDLPQIPETLPLNERARPILESNEQIARQLASQLTGFKPVPFYSTGTVLQGLEDVGGLSPDESMTFMRDWSGQGAATSPRTKTPPNLRNASYLLNRQAEGDPLTYERWLEQEYGTDAKGNIIHNAPGFPMIGKMHLPLSQGFFNDTVNPLRNPKPYTFRENWSGNMADVTVDTHNIRAVLDAFDRLHPGKLPREWFANQGAYEAYVANKGFPAEGALPRNMKIKDTLGGSTVNRQFSQTEYPVLQGPTKRAAEMLNISPAEAQERLWFQAGPRTGLRSPRMTIPDLLNAQIEATARATGLAPEAILRLWATRQIPLAQNEPQNIPGESAVG